MEKQDYRFYIQISKYPEGTLTVIHQDPLAFAGDKTISYSTVAKWHKSFSQNTVDIEDEPILDHSITAFTTENIRMVRTLIEGDLSPDL